MAGFASPELDICEQVGFGMMTRYDSKLIDWWNPAQEKLLKSKQYAEICQDVREVHGKDLIAFFFLWNVSLDQFNGSQRYNR